MSAASTLAPTPFSQGPAAAAIAGDANYGGSNNPLTSLHYIEESLSRAAAADPQPNLTTRSQQDARNGSPSHHRRRSPPLYGYSGTAPASGMYVRALYDYEADDRTSLSFHQGDVIQVLTQLESGWWDGVLHGVRGWFPSNYCVLIPGPEDHGAGYRDEPVDGEADIEDDEDDEDDDEDEDEDDDLYDEDDEDDVELDSNGNPVDESPQLPLEGTENRQHEAAAYWIPQATPDGKLFYFNTRTYDSTMELPLKTPLSANENGPLERGGHPVLSSSASARLRQPRQSQLPTHVEDNTTLEDGTSILETDGNPRPQARSRVTASVSFPVPNILCYMSRIADRLFAPPATTTATTTSGFSRLEWSLASHVDRFDRWHVPGRRPSQWRSHLPVPCLLLGLSSGRGGDGWSRCVGGGRALCRRIATWIRRSACDARLLLRARYYRSRYVESSRREYARGRGTIQTGHQ